MQLFIRIDGRYGQAAIEITIPELVRREFEPLCTNDDPAMCCFDGGLPTDSRAVRTRIQLRKNAAELLAKDLAEQLVSFMAANDTHNGYLKVLDNS